MLRLYILTSIVVFTSCAAFAEDAKTSADPNSDLTTLKFKMKKSFIAQPQEQEPIEDKDPELNSLLSTLDKLKLPSDPEWIETVKKESSPIEPVDKAASKTVAPTTKSATEKPKTQSTNKEETKSSEAVVSEKLPTDISEKYAATMAYSEYMREEYESAAQYYLIVLNKLDSKSRNYNTQRSWYLLQLGNCYKHFDSAKASERFSQLINEYPNSRWSNMARVELDLVRTLRDSDIDNTLNTVSKLLSDISATNTK